MPGTSISRRGPHLTHCQCSRAPWLSVDHMYQCVSQLPKRFAIDHDANDDGHGIRHAETPGNHRSLHAIQGTLTMYTPDCPTVCRPRRAPARSAKCFGRVPAPSGIQSSHPAPALLIRTPHRINKYSMQQGRHAMARCSVHGYTLSSDRALPSWPWAPSRSVAGLGSVNGKTWARNGL